MTVNATHPFRPVWFLSFRQNYRLVAHPVCWTSSGRIFSARGLRCIRPRWPARRVSFVGRVLVAARMQVDAIHSLALLSLPFLLFSYSGFVFTFNFRSLNLIAECFSLCLGLCYDHYTITHFSFFFLRQKPNFHSILWLAIRIVRFSSWFHSWLNVVWSQSIVFSFFLKRKRRMSVDTSSFQG